MNLNMFYVFFLLSHCDPTENVASWEVKTPEDCPGKGYSTYGKWTVSDKHGKRCVLVCIDGYEPDNCHVLRKHGTDEWNREIPQCVKKPLIPWKTVAKATAAVAAVAGAVVAAPVVIPAGSIAAGLQVSAVAAGSWFAAFLREQERCD